MPRLNARLHKLEAQADARDGPAGPGLAALLAWATRHPKAQAVDREDEDDEDKAPTGLTALLAEARQGIQPQDEDESGKV